MQTGKNFTRGQNVTICDGCRIGQNVTLGDNVYLDYDVIIRDNVTIGAGCVIGAGCIIGEYTAAWYDDHAAPMPPVQIGEKSVIRSGSIIYAGVTLGAALQTGHRVTIREEAVLGDHCSVGTLSDLQGHCRLGNYVRCHSNVHIGTGSVVEDFVWIYPYTVLTNDPTPPSEVENGVIIRKWAVVSTGSLVMPGVEIESDSLVAAGAVVTKNVAAGTVVGGNPAKVIATTDRVKNRETGETVYPWRYTFERGMPWKGIGYEAWAAAQGENCRDTDPQ